MTPLTRTCLIMVPLCLIAAYIMGGLLHWHLLQTAPFALSLFAFSCFCIKSVKGELPFWADHPLVRIIIIGLVLGLAVEYFLLDYRETYGAAGFCGACNGRTNPRFVSMFLSTCPLVPYMVSSLGRMLKG